MPEFPSTKCDVLAMLYLQNQDLSSLTPEELLDKFNDVHAKIKKHETSKYSAKHNPVKSGI